MRRLVGLWLAALVVVTGVASWSGSRTTLADESTDATVAALQTKVAKQATSIAKRDAKIDQLRTRIAELEVTVAVAPTAPAPAEAASTEGAESAVLGGNAVQLLPAGEDGTLDVVAVGPYDGNILPLILRNNTDQDVTDVAVSATARTAAGELIAAGGDQGFTPSVVAQGSYTMGYIYFDGIDLPADAVFEFDVRSEPFRGLGSFSQVDLEVSQAAFLGDRVVGEFRNGSEVTVAGPISIAIVCLGADGSIFGYERGFADKEEAAPGETIPFQVSFYSGIDCTNFIVAGSGYNF